MKNVSDKLVRITFEAAKKVGGSAKTGPDLTYFNALKAAVDSDKVYGPCEILVTSGPYSENDDSPTFHLTGTAVEAEPADMSDTSKIIARIRKDAGDDTVQLHEILNGDGLPLYYNGIFRETFMVKKGRVSREEVQNAMLKATLWCMANVSKDEFAKLQTDASAMVAKWTEAGKP